MYLWLPDTAGQDPYAVWTDSGNAFNNADNKTVHELLTAGSTGYRNTLVDDWTNTPPDWVMAVTVHYLMFGNIIFRA